MNNRNINLDIINIHLVIIMNDDNVISLAFSEIDPFVRLSGIYPQAKISPVWKQGYDCRLAYISDGAGKMDIGNATYMFSRGSLFFWLPGEKYRMTSSDSSPMEIINICFDFTQKQNHIKLRPPQTLKEYNPKLITEIPKISDVPILNKTIHLNYVQQIEHIVRDIAAEYQTQKKYASKRISGLLISLLVLISRYYSTETSQSRKSTILVDSIIEYIHTHIDGDLSNMTIATIFHFHPVHINRLFIQDTGTSLHKYVQNVRLQKAIYLLNISDLSVAQVSDAVGYNDPDYFSRLFKQQFGTCPSKVK